MLLPSRAKQANLKSRVVLQVSEVPGRQKTELCLLFRAKIHRRHMHHGKPRQNHTFCVCCFSWCRKESSANFTGFKNLLLRVKQFFHGLLSLRASQIAATKTSTHEFPISLWPGVTTEEHAQETSKDAHSKFHAPLFACRHGRTYCLAREDHWHSPANKMMAEIYQKSFTTHNKLMNSTRLLTILGGKDFFQQFKIQSSHWPCMYKCYLRKGGPAST